MPKIIVTSRYLKCSSKKNLKNYVKYIATREGAVPTVSERENYVGYLANRPGAVKFNSHGLFNEKDTLINLEKTAKEIADHNGNVWTHVVSLRRDDAQKMGYDNLNAWRELVIRQIPNIAKNQKIDMKNLQWYAAFHDKKTNPHVHIIVYSKNEHEGFLTNNGIEKIRSGFANDIYQDELHHLYEQQTDLRNFLKKESAQLMEQLEKSISENKNSDVELMNLVAKLHTQLAESKGKKVYGYLKSDVKKTIDEIFSKLADNESIKKMYELWCEMEQQKHDVYSSARVDFPSLVENKEFKSVKNMIIQTILKMDISVADIEIEVTVPDVDIPQIIEENLFGKYCLKWSDDYKNACNIVKAKNLEISDFQKAERLLLSESENGNVLAMLELGKLYSMEKSGLNDSEKSFEYYQKSLQGFLNIEPKAKKIKPYLQYRIGMMYFKGLGTQIDNQKAAEYFEKSAELGNQYAKRLLALEYISGKNFEHNIDKGISLLTECADIGDAFSCYQLGRLYFFGADGFKKDKEKAMQYLSLSAEQGNGYAKNILDNQEKFENEVLADTVFSLFVNLSRCIEDDYNRSQKNMQSVADSRLRRMIRKKKEELGIKEENSQQQV
ncbi:MAG: relaxase MobL [Ruminococcus flavefaciens]|nr:relaxase MobL [Ruminococcus flavefaciens]